MSAVAGKDQLITDTHKAQFRTDGYTMVPGVLSQDEVSRLRAFLEDRFDGQRGTSDGGQGRIIDTFFSYQDMAPCWSALNGKAIQALRSLLGDGFVVFPASSAHDSSFGIWHKDTSSLEQRGWQFHREPDFLMAQVTIYLQDNNEYGGGLTVIPGSHLNRRDRAVTAGNPRSVKNRVTRRLFNEISNRRGVAIQSKAGDLLMFDFRLDHRASQPTCDPSEIPSGQRKFALFFPSSGNNEHARAYMEYLRNADYWSTNAGRAYPKGVQEFARSRDITLV